jgi:hypothetical protein
MGLTNILKVLDCIFEENNVFHGLTDLLTYFASGLLAINLLFPGNADESVEGLYRPDAVLKNIVVDLKDVLRSKYVQSKKVTDKLESVLALDNENLSEFDFIPKIVFVPNPLESSKAVLWYRSLLHSV